MVSVICLDKTGTLTENRMEVRSVFDFRTALSEDLQPGKRLQNTGVLWWARLACEANPFDAMEQAIVSAYASQAMDTDYGTLSMVHEYALGGQPPMMTHVYEKEGRRLVAAKGAPERILKVCRMDPGEAAQLRQRITGLASSGYRVLGVCSASGHEGAYPVDQDNFDWQFEGLLALYDPPKKNVTEVIAQWRQAGIVVKVLSGDYAETVLNIARQAGIPDEGKILTGEEVNGYAPEELRRQVRTVNIYARMYPEAKLKVVDALKANGNIVAMTGDGVNDGPALQAAHIGIAMGDKGTEIAREAADLVVSDDDLGRITEAIQHGRVIHHNLKKATRYLISIHIPIILTASLPLLLGWRYPTIFSPIHIIFLELIMGPTCSIFYEREPVEKGIMQWHPRPGGEKLFRGRELAVALSLGLATATGLLAIYFYFMQHGYSLPYTRTVVFITLVISNILLTFMGRSLKETLLVTIRYPNNLVPVILVLSVSFFAFLYFVPFARRTFELSMVSGWHVLAALATALASTGWLEVYKLLRSRSTTKTI
jgi:Ca2+-transporting ATPase